VRIALAGDTMLGRRVGDALRTSRPRDLVDSEVVAVAAEADVFVLNLECCISERGERWPDPRKPFFFRGPPAAVELLAYLGVDCVTLANNHALDFGAEALLDTLEHLRAGGVAAVGAGADEHEARAPMVLEAAGLRLGVVAFTDHPSEFAAGAEAPGVAFAELDDGLPAWLEDGIRGLEADVSLVTPHWGPNMVAEPAARLRRAAAALVEAGATLVAGHSAHVFHGVAGRVLYDLGDFLDDYAVDRRLRNDLGLLFLVTLERGGPTQIEAVPLALDYCRTRLATPDESAWIESRFGAACARLGTEVGVENGRLVVRLDDGRD
jgi:poly-gamma-glutamate synthesis protein (capsule biosynthesis protein)